MRIALADDGAGKRKMPDGGSPKKVLGSANEGVVRLFPQNPSCSAGDHSPAGAESRPQHHEWTFADNPNGAPSGRDGAACDDSRGRLLGPNGGSLIKAGDHRKPNTAPRAVTPRLRR